MGTEQYESGAVELIRSRFAGLTQRIEEHPPVRLLAGAITGVLALGVGAVESHHEQSQRLLKVEAASGCVAVCSYSDLRAGNLRLPEPAPTTTTQPTTTSAMLPTLTITSPAPEAPPPVEVPVSSFENIEKMNLTVEGFVKALSSIRMDYYDYAQSKPEFNPRAMARRGISQQRTRYYTEHVTANYYNSDGTVTVKPEGNPSTKVFIDTIVLPEGKCCAVNQYIDRNGQSFWLAPRQAKLRHDKGHDGITTGKEIEAYLQSDATPFQLEVSAYIDIGNAIVDGLIDQPLEDIIEGHAQKRKEYNDRQEDSADKYPVKIDWNEKFTGSYREKIRAFLNAHPNLRKLLPASFLALP